MSITVLLVEDDSIMRSALRELLRRSEDVDVIAEAWNGADAVRLSAEMRPDVVVIDVGLPSIDGIEATKQILASHSATGVVVLSGFWDHDACAAAREAGAASLIAKERAFEELIPAVSAAAAHAR